MNGERENRVVGLSGTARLVNETRLSNEPVRESETMRELGNLNGACGRLEDINKRFHQKLEIIARIPSPTAEEKPSIANRSTKLSQEIGARADEIHRIVTSFEDLFNRLEI